MAVARTSFCYLTISRCSPVHCGSISAVFSWIHSCRLHSLCGREVSEPVFGRRSLAAAVGAESWGPQHNRLIGDGTGNFGQTGLCRICRRRRQTPATVVTVTVCTEIIDEGTQSENRTMVKTMEKSVSVHLSWSR